VLRSEKEKSERHPIGAGASSPEPSSDFMQNEKAPRTWKKQGATLGIFQDVSPIADDQFTT
jgi:hypothetical protein